MVEMCMSPSLTAKALGWNPGKDKKLWCLYLSEGESALIGVGRKKLATNLNNCKERKVSVGRFSVVIENATRLRGGREGNFSISLPDKTSQVASPASTSTRLADDIRKRTF